jgi:hypothetical protein
MEMLLAMLEGAAARLWSRTGTGNWRWPSPTRQTTEGAKNVGTMMVFASYGWDDCSDRGADDFARKHETLLGLN